MFCVGWLKEQRRAGNRNAKSINFSFANLHITQSLFSGVKGDGSVYCYIWFED